MSGIEDWIDIFAPLVKNGAGTTLSPSEVLRLAHDLEAARNTIAKMNFRLMDYEVQLSKTEQLAERFSEATKNALVLARKFADRAA
jgi:hypothetical protein